MLSASEGDRDRLPAVGAESCAYHCSERKLQGEVPAVTAPSFCSGEETAGRKMVLEKYLQTLVKTWSEDQSSGEWTLHTDVQTLQLLDLQVLFFRGLTDTKAQRTGLRSDPAPNAMPREKERDAKEPDTMKEESGTDVSVRSRKRKANVAVFLQDPDEEIAKIDKTVRSQCGSQPWDSNTACENPCSLIPTPDKEEDELLYPHAAYKPQRCTPSSSRASPLPVLNWANREEVWKIMLNKEKTYLRDKHLMQRHPLLQPKMRAILLDWLMEVCEVYKLHRETFYLAQDFFDRYMATQQNVVKTLLQLIGISSLFIAAKLEEIYPPKLHQFAYVTDGACSGDEILTMELIIMKALKWHLSPLTIVSWLNVYMQVAYLNDFYEVLLPQYPQQIFIQIAELLDLCVLDVGCLEFSYGVLAASALYHFSSSELMQKVSGYQWCDIEKCVKWMVPFAIVIRETGSSKLKHFRGVPAEDAHNIQTHINSLDLLDKAQAKKAILSEENRISPLPTGVLTPPQSSKKQSSGQGSA
ncbi:hypothetical protein JEQ12_005154 [Ovis aries]|uniref:G1/S-specific cyclin-E1 n=3 Tax=Caprinae TaxID=9963 RepID=A0A836CWY0_SHEEP|nr:hypothetical protein JEQ12_005154 [Ovis aries]